MTNQFARFTTICVIVFVSLGLKNVCVFAQDKPTTKSSIEEQFISQARQLTFEGRRAGEGYFSADGSAMVFQSERVNGNPFFQIFVLDFDTGDIEPVSPGHGKTTCAWLHPNGQQVLFASTHEDPKAVEKQREEIEIRESGQERRYSWDYDENYELFSFDRNEKTYKRLTNDVGYDAEGSYSPDGKLIAFASNRRAYDGTMTAEQKKAFEIDPAVMMDIFIMNSDGTDVRQLTDVMGYDGGPFFSPDGKKICWRRFHENGASAEIMTMNIDGSDEKQITRTGAMSWAPFFHPSGEYLVYTTNVHGFGNFELYIVDSEGRSAPVRVTDTKGFDGLASFTPDGNKISWTSNRMANDLGSRVGSQIFLGNWNHKLAMDLLANSRRKSDSANQEKETSEATSTGKISAEETAASFDARDVMRHVDYLCRKELGGRMTGTIGERKATAYVAAYMDSLGMVPAGDNGTWFQEFEFPNGAELGKKNQMSYRIIDEQSRLIDGFKVNQDWRPLSFSGNVEVQNAPVVFAGYGIVAPEKDGVEAYDSYKDLDVKDKWALVFRFVPEDVDSKARNHFQFYGNLRKKVFHARQNGAKGLIVMTGPRTKVRNQLVPMQNDFSPSGSSIAAISVTDDVATAWMKTSGKNLSDLQAQLDTGKQLPGFDLKGVDLSVAVDIKKIVGKGRNVLGRLQAGDSPYAQAVLVGAHIDHLGAGNSGSSLATDSEKNNIHFGADDNASGVAAMLEVAEYLASLKRKGKLPMKRDVIFAGWSGEELGLHGSQHYTNLLGGPLGPATPETKSDSVTIAPEQKARIDEQFQTVVTRLKKDLSAARERRVQIEARISEFESKLDQVKKAKANSKGQLLELREMMSQLDQGKPVQKDGETLNAEQITKIARSLRAEFTQVEQEQKSLLDAKNAVGKALAIAKKQEAALAENIQKVEDSSNDLQTRRDALSAIQGLETEPELSQAELTRRIRERDAQKVERVQSLLQEIDKLVKAENQPTSQEPATGDASFHDFKIVVRKNGAMTLNGKPTSLEELKPDLKFIGSISTEFSIEIVGEAGSTKAVEGLLALCKEFNVQFKMTEIEKIEATSGQGIGDKIVAALNMDMVGRMEEKLVLQGIASSSYWKPAIESKNAVVGLPIMLNNDTELPTDASSFYRAGVPILSAFTGSHTDYHTPRDTPEKLNYPDAARIARLMGLITRALVIDEDVPDYIRVAKKPKQTATRGGRRAYLGTVPSYGEDVVGVKLSDATKGAPAALAGVLGGDIIVELDGRDIENIYDYTAVLDGLKIGKETSITVMRDGKRLELKITPGSRQ